MSSDLQQVQGSWQLLKARSVWAGISFHSPHNFCANQLWTGEIWPHTTNSIWTDKPTSRVQPARVMMTWPNQRIEELSIINLLTSIFCLTDRKLTCSRCLHSQLLHHPSLISFCPHHHNLPTSCQSPVFTLRTPVKPKYQYPCTTNTQFTESPIMTRVGYWQARVPSPNWVQVLTP